MANENIELNFSSNSARLHNQHGNYDKESNDNEDPSMRVLTGESGYSEWMNELQVYLLPNFKHKNIFDLSLGDINLTDHMFDHDEIRVDEENVSPPHCIKTALSHLIRMRVVKEERHQESLSPAEDEGRADEGGEDDEDIGQSVDGREQRRMDSGVEKTNKEVNLVKIEYLLKNKTNDYMTLRDYLRMRTITWRQMIGIATGIVQGLNYLHENDDFQSFDRKKLMEGFIQSTNGAIQRVHFTDRRRIIRMEPPVHLSVVHRDLSSLNILIKGDELTPCIWNFGSSYIYHPFQPTNRSQLIDSKAKNSLLSSPYSPPEVLQEAGYLTLPSMKSIDMYACGIIFWELLSRCVLPILDIATQAEHRQRVEPEEYCEPFIRECEGSELTPSMLKHIVCVCRARPKLKPNWLLGKKTNIFVQTVQDLWDQDNDARLHSSTVLNRLASFSLSDSDRRFNHIPRMSVYFDIKAMWPPKPQSRQLPLITKNMSPNRFIGDYRSDEEDDGEESLTED